MHACTYIHMNVCLSSVCMYVCMFAYIKAVESEEVGEALASPVFTPNSNISTLIFFEVFES